jgi:hypothetical protein
MSNALKLAAALAFLGERWCLHPARYVRRQPTESVLGR